MEPLAQTGVALAPVRGGSEREEGALVAALLASEEGATAPHGSARESEPFPVDERRRSGGPAATRSWRAARPTSTPFGLVP